MDMREFAEEYRRVQNKIGGRVPPCLSCPDERIFKCSEMDLSEMRKTNREPCELFHEYAEGTKRGAGKTGRINRTSRCGYQISRQDIVAIRGGKTGRI